MRFNIFDTGIGIPKNIQESLFDAFSQADTSTTRKYGGTGLGLSISKQIVQMMGGEIGLDSPLNINSPSGIGNGSCFWFEINLGKSKNETDKSELTENESADNGEVKLKILVAEDNVVNQKVVANLVKLSGWACWRFGDRFFIDGLIVNGSASSIGRISKLLKRLQTGYLYHSVFIMITGFFILLVWLTLAK